MTTQRPSLGNSIYAPLIMVGLWSLHGLITWYFSRELPLTLWAFGLVAFGTLLTQWFLRPRGSHAMIWRPGLFAFTLALTWAFWLILNIFWDMQVQSVVFWPLIGFISTHESTRQTSKARRAQDLGI